VTTESERLRAVDHARFSPDAYDSSVTTDLRPAAFDQLREENTTLATENERLRTALAVTEAALADSADENARVRSQLAQVSGWHQTIREGREIDSDTFLRRIDRLRRALVRERQNVVRLAGHVADDHEAMDRDSETRDRQAVMIRTLSNQRADLLGATRQAGDALLTAVAERDEARRAIEAFAARLRPVSDGE
jgi:regulator of replication initiation timing